MAAMATARRHSPTVVERPDGRWEVRCEACLGVGPEQRPVGIGIPVTNRSEAESMARNHQQRVA